ncbi:MAG TPA: hypothetical protein VHU13_05010 [Solirubrobacteraceae bacterium]|nr:hypothetical protein [Solirubrobacteraceae bacterium]
MDHEVARTLAELELKLRELERELTELGRQTAEPTEAAASVTPPTTSLPFAPPAGGQAPRPKPLTPGRLVDEAAELPPPPAIEATPASRALRYSMEAQETAFGEIPATHDEQASIDLAELVRFRETLQQTLQGLIDEYSRLLSLRPGR